jgi:hypothetical protein
VLVDPTGSRHRYQTISQGSTDRRLSLLVSMVGSYPRTTMAGRKRITKPLSPELRALRVELQEVPRGVDPRRPLYKATSTDATRAFIRNRVA